MRLNSHPRGQPDMHHRYILYIHQSPIANIPEKNKWFSVGIIEMIPTTAPIGHAPTGHRLVGPISENSRLSPPSKDRRTTACLLFFHPCVKEGPDGLYGILYHQRLQGPVFCAVAQLLYDQNVA